ncbi:MAG TPA: CPBP family intramembrane glutamic endopeptidase [Allosphingosinicella sp.]|nr:CPBP family intramembrane glutamic endopeptidase [Allosphingosinicella sp.]
MTFADWLINDLVFIAIALLWAAAAKLDLGFRAPAWRGVWPWVALYVAWYAAEWVVFALLPVAEDPEWVTELLGLPLAGQLILTVVSGPIFEELLFRGAMFSALLRRWGIQAAAIAPSVLWALMHVGYEAWFIFSIAGSGVVLAIIRWKSGSLWPPLALHVMGNLVVTLDPYSWFAATG